MTPMDREGTMRRRSAKRGKPVQPRIEVLETRQLLNAGSLDVVFGAAGQTTTALSSGPAQAEALSVQPNGKVLVVGEAGSGKSSFALARYNINGSLDSGFGTAGVVSTAV